MGARGRALQMRWAPSTSCAAPPPRSGEDCVHRRLSILDLSTAATQPMTDPVAGHTIIFNGEIYNYVALRNELQSAGEKFGSTGDTAVMLRLLATRGHRRSPSATGSPRS